MRKLLITIMLLLPLVAGAVKIKHDEIDEFTGKRYMYTSWERVKGGKIQVRFRREADKDHIDIRINNGAGAFVMSKGDKVLFKSGDGDIAAFESDRAVVSELIVTSVGNTHRATLYLEGSAEWFTNHLLKLMRVCTGDGTFDEKFSGSDAQTIYDVAQAYFRALESDTPVKSISCTIEYMRKPKSRKDWTKIKEERIKDGDAVEIERKAADWRSKTDDSTDYDVVIKKG